MDSDDSVEDAPLVRLTNALLLMLLKERDEFLRISVRDGSTEFRAPGSAPWRSGPIEVPEALAAALAARLLQMAGFDAPPEDAQAGMLQLVLGADEREVFYIHHRPCRGGAKVVVHWRSPEWLAAALAPRPHDALTEDLGRLIFGAEPGPDDALAALAERADSLGDDYTRLEARSARMKLATTPAQALSCAEDLLAVAPSAAGSRWYAIDAHLERARALCGLKRTEQALEALDETVRAARALQAYELAWFDLYLDAASLYDQLGERAPAEALRQDARRLVQELVGEDDRALDRVPPIAH